MTGSFFWLQFPFVRYVILLISGILLSSLIEEKLNLTACYQLLLICCALYVVCRWNGTKIGHKVAAALAMIIIIMVGGLRKLQTDPTYNQQHIIHIKTEIESFKGTLISVPVPELPYTSVIVKIEKVFYAGQWHNKEGKVLVYIKNLSHEKGLRYRDQVMIKARLQLIPETTNPQAFSFRQYNRNRHIFHQCFTEETAVLKIESYEQFSFLAKIIDERLRLISQVHFAIPQEEVKSVMMPLLFGDKQATSDSVSRLYSEVGAMHILAVSGLHVGVIYMIITGFFKFLGNRPFSKWLAYLFTMMILWAYVIFTGMSVSVLRAVCMFSFYLTAGMARRKASIVNNLSLAAFTLLLIDPKYLVNVGFQLSFAAVVGIVYFQPRLARLYRGKNRIVKYFWEMTALSLSVQLATFPISIYYFHQFPTYFAITNFLAIPGAFVMICLGILMCIELQWAPAGWIFTKLTQYIVTLLNTAFYHINQWPFHVLENIHLHGNAIFLIYSIIILVTLFLLQKRFHCLIGAFALAGFLSFSQVFRIIKQKNRQVINFYDVRSAVALDLISGFNNQLVVVTNQEFEMLNLGFAIRNFRIKNNLPTDDLENMKQCIMVPVNSNKLYAWKGKKILFVNEQLRTWQKRKTKIKVDYIIISNQSVTDLPALDDLFIFDKLIISNLNSLKYSRRIREMANELGWSVHLIPIEGAFSVVNNM